MSSRKKRLSCGENQGKGEGGRKKKTRNEKKMLGGWKMIKKKPVTPEETSEPLITNPHMKGRRGVLLIL